MEFCNRETFGTCSWVSCSSSRGPTKCIDGICKCERGYCSFGDRCRRTSMCDREGCSDGCVIDDVCTPKCETNTGGRCRVFGCSSARNAECKNSYCVCKHGDCVGTDESCHSGADISFTAVSKFPMASTQAEPANLELATETIEYVTPLFCVTAVGA